MRILYNSKDIAFKSPFGTLTEGERCRITINVPSSCKTIEVRLILLLENMCEYKSFPMEFRKTENGYDLFSVSFILEKAELYFYYFRITTQNEAFSLYREGYDRTNMEAGELWQLSCIPAEFSVPESYFGSVMYQIFPDRFNQCGECDVTEKLKPFSIHENKRDIPNYLPNESGEIENCDFFGGNLNGISSRLGYLKELGVSVIYLNPIFKAWSNHRYDTADYHKIDELLGTEQDFSSLCAAAHERGMKIILDGVFSHTGSHSIYFDKMGIFGNGAYSCPTSPYRSWYDFKEGRDDYTCWWGIDTLPATNEMEDSFKNFIIDSENSVIAHWLRAGADGFRLDVADELPDEFISAFRKRLKEIKPDALLIGEVWEDASNKISYGKRRRYFVGGELDSVMNYPFRSAIIDYVLKKDDGTAFRNTVMTIAENYPRSVLNTLMNFLSTHDTPRILSVFSGEDSPRDKNLCAGYSMPDTLRPCALMRLRVGAFLQFVLPGMPCIYYADELGCEGFEDPFNRTYFPWDLIEGNPIRNFFIRLCNIRNSSPALKFGELDVKCDGGGRVTIERKAAPRVCRAFVNMGEPVRLENCNNPILLERGRFENGILTLDSYGFMLEEFSI